MQIDRQYSFIKLIGVNQTFLVYDTPDRRKKKIVDNTSRIWNLKLKKIALKIFFFFDSRTVSFC